tara:strand:+ start:278 stop:496 length:219 start_codon:yes stop_codon:yes gene_type:complete
MQEEEAKEILKAAEEACFEATFEIHKVARRHNNSIVVEVGGVPTEIQPLTNEELNVRQNRKKRTSASKVPQS